LFQKGGPSKGTDQLKSLLFLLSTKHMHTMVNRLLCLSPRVRRSVLRAQDLTFSIRINSLARCQWLTPVILATQEAEIRRITFQRQIGQIVYETLSQKKPFTHTKKGLVVWLKA
jgi:hypothetical protein